MKIKRATVIYFLCSLLLVTIAFSSVVSAQITTDPLPGPIAKSQISVGLQDVVQIPNSGNNQPARLNLLIPAGDGSGRLFVNDMRGTLYVINDGSATTYMDINGLVGSAFYDDGSGQQGFSYFAFHPQFATNGIFYTVHSENKNSGTPDFPVTKTILDSQGNIIQSSHHDVIREWTATDPTANTFSGTFREILRIEQPYPDHNTGQLNFNPNAKPGDADYGILYIALGDGGSDGYPVHFIDPLNNSQDLGTPLGKILRIDPFGNNSSNGKYGIPADNPFVNSGSSALGEIWAYGLRNPHRFSWDTGGTGKLLISDIGQAFIEEVNLGKAGANYGWSQREGTFATVKDNEHIIYNLPDDDSSFNYTYPVAQYGHDIPSDATGFYGVSIAGGYTYRGTAIPQLVGQYVFADFANDGRFFLVPVHKLVDGSQATINQLRLFNGEQETSFQQILGEQSEDRTDVRFGIDESGELYVTSKQDGKVRKIIPSPQA